MKNKFGVFLRSPLLLAICACGIGLTSTQAQVTQTFTPTNWVNDPFSFNANWGIVNSNTVSPTYTNNGVAANGNLFGYSPIGGTITLTQPGQTVTLTSLITVAGSVNTAGNVQFRIGLYNKGANATDTGWAGDMVSQPTGGGGAGLYLRAIPNTGSFGSGTGANQPAVPAANYSFASGWNAGTYNFSLSVTYLSASSSVTMWEIKGVTTAYNYSARFTNTTTTAQGGYNFDTVGFLGGGSTFTAASTADTITFSNTQVTVGNFSDGTWTNDASGIWSNTVNWAGGIPANGTGFKADFSQVALTADRTVTLDSSRNIGGMTFGATGGSLNNWILNNSGGSVLTLNSAGNPAVPAIAVNQNTTTLSLPLVSSNGLTKTGAGILVLGGTNTILGTNFLNGGELGFSSLSNLPLSPSGIPTIVFNGGGLLWEPGNTLDISGLGIIISFAGNGTFDTGANNVTLSTTFGDLGAGGLIKQGSGKLTLNGVNAAYLGNTLVSNGTLAFVGGGSVLGSTNITVLSAATLDVSGVPGGYSLLQNLSGTGTLGGNVSDSGFNLGSGFASTGAAGTLTVNGNLTLGAGTLTFGLANVTTAGSGVNDLINVTGALNISGPMTVNLSLINGAPGLGTYTLFTYGTFSGSAANITAPAGFVVTNNTVAKTIGLVVTHIPTNLTWLGDGNLNNWDTDVTSNWLGSGALQFFFAGDSVTFNDNGSGGTTFPITIAAGGVAPASVTVSNNAVTYDFTGGAITSGQLIKTNSGTLILENNNTYPGPTTIGGGVVQVGGLFGGGLSGTLGTGPITNNASLVFNLDQNYTVSGNIAGTGTISDIGGAGTIFLSGNVSAGSVIQNGNGASLQLTGSNNITGQILAQSGTLLANSAFALSGSTNAVTVASGGQLYINANVNITNKPITLAGTGVGGTGALRKGGNGVTTFGGVIKLTNSAQIDVDGGSTFNLTNATPIASTNLTNVSLTLDAASGGVGNITSQLSLGTGTLTVQDAGTWSIAPSNNYTGLTILNGGLLVMAGPNALGPVSSFTANYVTLNGGSLGITNNLSFSDGLRGFTVSGTAGGFDVTNGMTFTISNPITGGGTLVKSDSGTLILAGSNTFAGTLDVDSGANALNDGVLEIANPNAVNLAVSPIAIRNNLGGASTFELSGVNGNIVLTQDITLNGRSPAIPAIVNASGTNTLGGNLTCGAGGSRYTLESDSGLLTLGSAGKVLIFTTVDAQVFTFQGNGAFLVAGVVTNATNGTSTTGITMNGIGNLTLSAVNTYTGPTTVSSGALIVTGTTGTGAVNVTGGTLGGSGTIGGAVTTSAGSSLSPSVGGTPVTTLTLASNLSLGGNVVININKSLAQTNDKVVVSGTASGSGTGTVTVNNLGASLAAGDKFQIFSGAVTGAGTMTVTGGGAVWANNLAGDGTIQVVSTGRPAFTSAVLSGNNLVLHGTNGAASGSFNVLSSTNVAAPLSSWILEKSGTYDGSGNFTVTNVISNGVPKKFYILQQ